MKKSAYIFSFLLLLVIGTTFVTPLGDIISYRFWPDYPKNKNETINFAKMSSKASIAYDENGVPHIKASSLADLCRAIGFAHARYRGFQMDLLRKFSAGRLSELLGNQKALTSTTVEFDLAMRGWNFQKKAKFKKSDLSAQDLMILNSYAEGVNKAMQKYPTIEHRILGVEPEPWTPNDTLLVGLLQAWSLTHNWEQEALRFSLALELGLAKAQEVYPFRPLYNYGTLDSETNIEVPNSYAPEVLEVLNKKSKVVGASAFGDLMKLRPFASNAWVTKPKGRLPILHNDMHLTHSLPGLIFLQSISVPGFSAVGAAIPGLPFLISGFNGKVAWGVTSSVADVADLVIERPEAVHSERIEIKIKGEDSRILSLRRSKHGPIFNDMYPDQLPKDAPLLAIKFETPELAKSLGALYLANRAQNVYELRESLMKVPAPIQNIMAADMSGNIGFFSTGSVPLREHHQGIFPVPGWTEKYDWKGWTPMEQMPNGFNPKTRLFANNNNLVHDPYKNLPIFHIDAAASHRFDRINQLASADQSFEKLRSFQTDDYLMRAQTLVPIFLSDLSKVKNLNKLELKAYHILRSWDYSASSQSAGAALFNMTYKKAIHSALNSKVSAGLAQAFLKQRYSPGVADTWFKDENHYMWEAQRSLVLAKAFKSAVKELSSKYGEDPSEWNWGKLHFIRPTHPFGKRSVLAFFNLNPAALAGGLDSLWKAHFNMAEPGNYQVIAGPVYRFSIDLNDPSSAKFMTDTGASGLPLSPHYGDMYTKWTKGELISLSKFNENWPTIELAP